MEGYTVKRVFNNNALLVQRGQEEYVLVGKGIGFDKKRGSQLAEDAGVENVFIHVDATNKSQMERLLENTDEKIFALVEDIVTLAENELSENLHQDIHLALADHIAFAVKRIKEGMKIVNPFILETKMIYQKEYEIAEKTIEMMRKRLFIDFSEAEIGFIALHINGARIHTKGVPPIKYLDALKQVIDYVEERLGISIQNDSFSGVRLIAHLKGVLERCEKNKPIENMFLDKLKKDFPFEFKLSKNIALILKQNIDIMIPESEVGYIALHIYKLNQTR
ncbi:PRD domain-containing protein [Alkalibacter saccharofermentans]|uniref:Transcriptional antiterminator, BglG family n=1 Tax=Alkalibacter saccharofermentans DSM 14828 TaxID=1120975 RepID=A0A1M4T3H2_9FIRM|nr:PRD domain-containing protein [Alkalibacter saccharofermentans]SHE39009.1 transcriptional antiterminator, BglG family [Alkalibacter saccharofermentans DSM 14828]